MLTDLWIGAQRKYAHGPTTPRLTDDTDLAFTSAWLQILDTLLWDLDEEWVDEVMKEEQSQETNGSNSD